MEAIYVLSRPQDGPTVCFDLWNLPDAVTVRRGFGWLLRSGNRRKLVEQWVTDFEEDGGQA